MIKPSDNIDYIGGKYTPGKGKTLLLIGQDLETIGNYCSDSELMIPSGTVSYINFYAITREEIYLFGGLGINNDLEPQEGTADWGAGPLNAYKNIQDYPDSVIAIGLSLVEDYSAGWTLQAITEGNYDENIDKLAYYIELADRPVYLRIGYEFDGIWNNYPQEDYKKAFRYIVERIKGNEKYPGADKYLVSVWQSCTSPSNEKSKGKHYSIDGWYPGDDVVDWVGFSYFIPHWEPEPGSNIMNQHQLTDEILEFAREKKKPVMMAEASPQGFNLTDFTMKNVGWVDGAAAKLVKEYDQDESGAAELWKDWYKPYFDYIEDNKDVIRAVTYINANWDSQPMWAFPYTGGYWGDARVEANPYIKDMWLAEMKKDHWLMEKVMKNLIQ